MKNLKKILFLIVLLFKVASLGSVDAAERSAGNSATLVYAPSGANKVINTEAIISLAKQKEAIRRMLERRNSPLINEVDAFMATCTRYALPCYLLPSITGLESSFGSAILPGSNNPFGWGGGYILFSSWSEGIDTVGQGLRERYVPTVSKHEVDPYMIGPKYAASKTWAVRVDSFMREFEAEEAKIQLNKAEINI